MWLAPLIPREPGVGAREVVMMRATWGPDWWCLGGTVGPEPSGGGADQLPQAAALAWVSVTSAAEQRHFDRLCTGSPVGGGW
jgi:hypothetical protein